jgi:3-hydroxyisobutyrate dehydrogenase-like beta-hydroxyacid dehydrogenase
MERIGWIGTGVLGTAIVKRLLTQNIAVTVFNRTEEKARVLVENGATLASSPCALAQECSTVFLCLAGHEAIEDVIFDHEQGIVAAGARELCIIDTSTISPSFALSLATRLLRVGIHYLEAPVSGGPENALLGKLACIIAGSQMQVQKHQELMAAFTSSLHYVGHAGNAQLIKVLNNLAESINLLGAAEVLAIGLRAGLDLDTLHSVLPTMRGYSTYMGVLLDRLINPRDEVSFAVTRRLKDLKLAHQVADDYAVATPMGALAEQLFTLVLSQEGPLADQTACIRLYEGKGREKADAGM